MRTMILAAFIIAVAISEITNENGILVLDDSNFQETIKKYENMFVEFYSSNVRQSMQYTPMLEHVKVVLQEKGMNAVIAKIDHYTCPNVAQIYRIGGFPVIYHFKKGSPQFYDGELDEKSIQFFIEKRLDPGLKFVTEISEIEKAVASDRIVIVGHFAMKSGKEYKNYRKAASVFTDWITLCAIGDVNVDIPINTVHIYTSGEKRIYDGSNPFIVKLLSEMTVKDLKKWLSIKSLPLIIPYERRFMKIMFAKDNGISVHLLFVSSRKHVAEHPELKELLEKIAVDYTNRLFVVNIYDDDKNMLDYFGVRKEDIPTLCIVRSGETEVSKYAFRGVFEDSGIRSYIESFFNDELKPFYRSEEIYKERDKNVKVLVQKDFEEFAFDPKVNVLVEFVVTNCKRCDAIHDDINILAGYFVDVPDIDVARVDISKNDISGVEVKSYPMFVLYTAGNDGRNSITFEKEPSLANLVLFIKEKRVHVAPADIMEGMMEKEVDMEF